MSGDRTNLERELADIVRAYADGLERGNDAQRVHAASRLGSWCAHLLATLILAEWRWDADRRWIDGLINSVLSYNRPGTVRLVGTMVWGLRSDVGGAQWGDPFEALFVFDAAAFWYRMWFGSDAPLRAKQIQSGLYSMIASEGPGQLPDLPGSSRDYEPDTYYCYVLPVAARPN